ncbi:hypothetical protein F5Y16DRAFT_403446 [Xylariaceae sp. FL0255]|nr:hypothetical protein F5Y16DRAFT_403446 [Xylariaceae sp. FL0255]
MSATRNGQRSPRLLSTLPTEIILEINDQITSAADAVSLALTCRRLFSVLSEPSIKALNAQSKEMLLMNLERDISWVVYCPRARRLLNFNSWGKGHDPSAPWAYQRFHIAEPLFFRSMCKDIKPHISFLQTRLVRNRHLFGATHGIPLSELELEGSHDPRSLRTFMRMPCNISFEFSRKAGWRGEDLFLSSTWIIRIMSMEVVGQAVSTTELRKFLADESLDSTCNHCTFDGIQNDRLGYFQPKFDEVGARLSNNLPYEGVGSCFICETDWDMLISWYEEGLELKLTRYHDLGCCSIPPDPKWLRIKYEKNRILRILPRETTQGSVRRRWVSTIPSRGGSL